MSERARSNHWNDARGHPAGGCTSGIGFTISWQNGPLGRGEKRQKPNGAFVEDIIVAARDRLAYYQQGDFACQANSVAIERLTQALESLEARTAERERRGVEGTDEP